MLRLLCIAVVVFFHAYGMMYASHFSDATKALYSQRYEFWNSTYLINIAMPMFVFISGFLFGGQLMKKNVTFLTLVKGKFMRLMVPFFVFTTLFMFTQNVPSFKPFYQWTYSHLWFLPMLFWCFIATWFLRPLILSRSMWISVTTVLLLILLAFPGRLLPRVAGLHNVNCWIGWFALGIWFFNHERALFPRLLLLRSLIVVGGLTSYFLVMYLFPQHYGERTISGTIVTILAIYSLWTLFAWIPWRNFAVTDFLMALSACSFGIFIFHNWLEALFLSKKIQYMFGLEELARDHLWLFPLTFSIVAFTLSAAITWILLKYKLGRKLLG